MNKSAFVTGGGGCVGRCLLRYLLDADWKIKVLLLPGEVDGFPFRNNSDVDYVTGSLDDVQPRDVPEEAMIFHLAAQVHTVPKTSEQRERFFAVNRDGTARLAGIAQERKARGFVFLSTIAVYGGQLEQQECDESARPQPQSPYAESKLQAEQKLEEILGQRTPYVILRPSVIYGPGDRGNFANMINAVAKGSFPVVDGGSARKNTLYVKNLAATMGYLAEMIVTLPATVFNVADPEPHSMREIAETVAKVTGISVRVRNLPSLLLRPFGWLGDLLGAILRREMPISSRRIQVMTTDSLVNTERLHGLLKGCVPYFSFEEGLRDYLFAEKDIDS
jgi:GlcNAc-P-P-Und epimerase